ncbi:uncharacterized protein LOC116416762 [Nasonia vitripennis]|uniref:Uncharacterized protein n=1 Tax=Nasonia vitripennis TaxID=7425 RepID=A0A7M7Q7Q9_NASVI|nr:uncharacterized protein LOC116416762 [Nasonia vitripennis]
MHQFISDFCPQTASYNQPPGSIENIEAEINSDIDSPFNLKELTIAIESCNKKSSPGLDQIDNIMLNNTPNNYRALLLHTINDIIASGRFPREWKEFLVMLLPKKEKNKFRPITLASLGPFYRHIGVPQGCVLSPTLYLIYVIYLNRHINPKNNIIQFADDTIIFTNNKSVEEGLATLQNNTSEIINFFQSIGLDIAPNKTQLIIFSNKNIDPNISITINGHKIKNEQAVKYLGVWLDSKLNWNTHAQNLIEKIQKTINIIKVLRTTWWGGHPQVLLNVYKGLIRSITDYNCFCINIKNPKLREKINKLQYKAIRLALGYRNSTPINVMLAESKEVPITTRTEYLADKLAVKIISIESDRLSNMLCELFVLARNKNKIFTVSSFPLFKSFIHYFYHRGHFIKKFNLPLPYPYKLETMLNDKEDEIISIKEGSIIQKSENPNTAFEEMFYNNPSEETVDFFTDGSKTEDKNHTGAAIYSPYNNLEKKFKFNKIASIFTAEAFAILQTLKIVLNKNIKTSRIFTDSQSVLQAIKYFSPLKTKNMSYLILDIKNLLYEIINKKLKLKIYWIPAHKNITNNEIVDKLAKDAITTGDQVDLKLPYTDMFEEIKKKEHKSFRKKLDHEKTYKGKLYFENYYEDTPKPWFYKTIANRYHITTINRIRSNHYSLAESLFRKNLTDSEECKCGFLTEDLDHVINEYLKKTFKMPNSIEAKFLTEFFKACNLAL